MIGDVPESRPGTVGTSTPFRDPAITPCAMSGGTHSTMPTDTEATRTGAAPVTS